jgi:hypothetical protein
VKREDFIYFEEFNSPDGVWRVELGYSGGEKGPTIIEPRVVEIATGRELINFWKTYVIGGVWDFTPDGFRIRLTEPMTSKTIYVAVNTKTETFVIADHSSSPRPLAKLRDAVADIWIRARAEYRS